MIGGLVIDQTKSLTSPLAETRVILSNGPSFLPMTRGLSRTRLTLKESSEVRNSMQPLFTVSHTLRTTRTFTVRFCLSTYKLCLSLISEPVHIRKHFIFEINMPSCVATLLTNWY